MSQPININAETNSMYIFQGNRFLEYIEPIEIKKVIKEKTGFEEQDGEGFGEYYKRFLTEKASEAEILEREFFESIFYGRLTNVFINKIKNEPVTEDIFKQAVKRLIDDMNSRNTLPPDVKRLMKEDGFYIMDLVNTTEKNTFLAGFDYSTANGYVDKSRFLITHVVPTKTDADRTVIKYLVCAIEINYTKKTLVAALKNIPNIVNEDENGEIDEGIQKTVVQAYKKFLKLFENHLQIQKFIKVKKDRRAMFEMCEKLDNTMLYDLREEIELKNSDTLKTMVSTLTEELFGKAIAPIVKQDNLVKRFKSLLLATYLDVMTEDDNLIYIAKSSKLVGYPTRVAFQSSNSLKGATGTSGASEPVATSVMFHSLYTDFQEALELPKWALSWFTDINHLTDSTEVIQTSVVSMKENFKVTFINKNHIGKELFQHVIGELSQCRDYEEGDE
ncbi:hypothetical protein QCI47_29105 [Bacillus cereus group sp. RP29]|uniref:hypothetical protein n=1 Tax=Bacillus cereus group TaxID=86661 RepID=UPI0008FE6104|nr:MULTISPECIES: hypothetical protein [Bacillus cereus group]MEC1632543.1 hypothetical protein [Bacillus paranthracis]OJE19433.1 hypothetical protein BAQ46_23925 [Bacillus paranthracis]OUA67900.1 hypothetical protein BK786_08140 [Bacillus thuringiensis serovar thailandensis]